MDEQPALFQPRPTTVTVPAVGVAQKWLARELGLAVSQLLTYHGDELGAPRDYVYRSGEFFYTRKGVEAIARLFALPIRVEGGEAVAVRAEEAPAGRRHRAERWDQDVEGMQ